MNQNQSLNDPFIRQYQLEKYREELKNYSGYCRSRQQQQSCAVESPLFNEHGHILNLPPNLHRVPQHPTPQFFRASNSQNYHETPDCNDFFSLCYTLSDDRNTPIRQLFEQFQHFPMVPKDMTPKKIILVYEKSRNEQILVRNIAQQASQHENRYRATKQTVDAAVGDYSVVRYNVETQTDWDDIRHKEETDILCIPHREIKMSATKNPTTTSNLSELDVPQYNVEALKVAKWLQVSKNIGETLGEHDSEQKKSRAKYNSKRNIPRSAYNQKSQLFPLRKTSFHGYQVSGTVKKQAVLLSIVRHPTVELEIEKKATIRVDGEGDDNQKNAAERSSDKEKKQVAANNACSFEESSVVKNCTPRIEVQKDVSTPLSHVKSEESKKEIEEIEKPDLCNANDFAAFSE